MATEARRKYVREWYRKKYADDPTYHERQKKKSREYRRKMARDPAWRMRENRRGQEERILLKAEFIAAYGGKCQCSCGCGITNPGVLTVEHLNGDGELHRRVVDGAGARMYRDLKRRGWPKDEGITVLCYNCNCGKSKNGGVCPLM